MRERALITAHAFNHAQARVNKGMLTSERKNQFLLTMRVRIRVHMHMYAHSFTLGFIYMISLRNSVNEKILPLITLVHAVAA
jgi:hypothetical protein